MCDKSEMTRGEEKIVDRLGRINDNLGCLVFMGIALTIFGCSIESKLIQIIALLRGG